MQKAWDTISSVPTHNETGKTDRVVAYAATLFLHKNDSFRTYVETCDK